MDGGVEIRSVTLAQREVDRLWSLLVGPTIDPCELEGQVRVVVDCPDLDYRTVRLLYQVSLDLPNIRGDMEFQKKIASYCQSVDLDTDDEKFTTLKHRLRFMMDVNTIKQYLRDLGTQIAQEEEITVGGSCAISLRGIPFRETDDLDVVDEIPVGIRSQRNVVNQLAISYGLRLTHFQSHYLPDGWLGRVKFFGRFGKLQVSLVDVYDIIAGKFFSARSKDKDDLRRLASVLDKGLIFQRIQNSGRSLMGDPKYYKNLLKNWYIVYDEQFESL
jgi:hypothetical protein